MSTSVSMPTSLPPVGTFNGTLPPFDPSKMPPRPPGGQSAGGQADFSDSLTLGQAPDVQGGDMEALMKWFAELLIQNMAAQAEKDDDEVQTCNGSAAAAAATAGTGASPMASFQVSATVYG